MVGDHMGILGAVVFVRLLSFLMDPTPILCFCWQRPDSLVVSPGCLWVLGAHLTGQTAGKLYCIERMRMCILLMLHCSACVGNAGGIL
jgi:hypothetical protein